jgi:hypothetical protein
VEAYINSTELYGFFDYTPSLYDDNPTAFTFAVTNVNNTGVCLTLELQVMFTCDETLCGWDNLTSGLYDYTVTGSPLGSIPVPALASYHKCGCTSITSSIKWLVS